MTDPFRFRLATWTPRPHSSLFFEKGIPFIRWETEVFACENRGFAFLKTGVQCVRAKTDVVENAYVTPHWHFHVQLRAQQSIQHDERSCIYVLWPDFNLDCLLAAKCSSYFIIYINFPIGIVHWTRLKDAQYRESQVEQSLLLLNNTLN